MLNTPGFYKEAASFKNTNSVANLMPNFVKKLIEGSGNPSKATIALLKGIYKHIDIQVALLSLFEGLALVENGEKYLHKEELKLIADIIGEKAKEFFISKKQKMAQYLISILYNHVEADLNDLVILLQYIPKAYFSSEANYLIDVKYKEMLQTLISPYNILKVVQEISLVIFQYKEYFINKL